MISCRDTLGFVVINFFNDGITSDRLIEEKPPIRITPAKPSFESFSLVKSSDSAKWFFEIRIVCQISKWGRVVDSPLRQMSFNFDSPDWLNSEEAAQFSDLFFQHELAL